jgi:hypothetical protein
MNMNRRIYDALVKWKNSIGRKPLVLEGARQVGKTFILKEFGRGEYENLIYINCDNNDFMSTLFLQDFDMERILRAISAYTNQPINAGKTLLFIDEIQESPRALTALKYFCENASEQHVVVAGSLLGIANREGESYPVGKVDILKLYPLSFEEFLWAVGEEQLCDLLNQKQWDILRPLDTKLKDLLRQYFYVGGMPEAVLSYITYNDVPKVRRIQKTILKTYERDFAKHAGHETQRIRLVWNSIPGQLAKENKKFIYGAVRKGARAKDFEMAIQWLVDAGLVMKLSRCLNPTMPLSFYEDVDAFKLYLLDVGLLGALANVPARLMLIENQIFVEFKGAFSENYVLQQLQSLGDMPVYYFSKDNSTQEVDFLLQTEERIVPIEVKAEENVKSKSLRGFITEDHADKHLKGLRCSMLPYIDQGWMENIPLYSVFGYFFDSFCKV